MNLILSIYIATLLIILVLIFFTLDNIKNIYQFEVILEKIFRNFLRLEKTSLDFTRNFYNYLCDEIRNAFVGKIALFYILEDNSVKLESLSSADGSSLDNIVFSHLKENVRREIPQEEFAKLGRVRPGKLSREMKKILQIEEKSAILLPIFFHKKLFSFYVLVHRNIVSYARSVKRLYLNSRKIAEFIMDINLVLKEREQSMSSVILSSIRDYAFITVDTGYHITSWNKGAEKMFGYDTIEIVNRKITDIIHDESIDDFNNAVKDLETKEEVKLQIYTRDCNDTLIISELVLKRIMINEVFSGIYIVIKDITKEEVWKNSIKRQSMITKSIVENASDGILLLNEENKIIYFNERFRKIVDNNASFIGMDLKDAFPPNYSELFLGKIDELKTSAKDLVFLNMKLLEQWYNIRFFPIKNKESIEGIIVFFIDNSFEMQTREKLEQMNNSLIENLQTAKMMHMNLIPSVLPDNSHIRFQSIYLPSDEIGGDFYYVDELKLGGKKFSLAMMADVSGHGVGSSMLTVLVKDIYSDFRNSLLSEKDIQLSRFLKMLNKKIINLNMNGSKFVTVFMLMIDIENRTMRYTSAGHPHAILINNTTEYFGMEKSPPVGIVDNFMYEEAERKVAPGDKIIIYSDGILEVFSHEVKLFNDYLAGKKSRNIIDLKAEIEGQIAGFISSDPAHESRVKIDDITVLLTEFLG
jgi:PAS domain S-box-containing protein